MAESSPDRLSLLTGAGVPLVAAFAGGRLASDGGLPWLAEADAALALCATPARCIPDWRRGPVIHTLETRVRQRVFQIACGDEDQDAADTLGTDPLVQLVCGRLPDSGAPLASQPTISPLEHHSSHHTAERLASALGALDRHARERQGPPRRILLDFDGTDDPAHGEQEGVAFHGDYDQYMDHPLLVFDGDTGQLIRAVVRPGHAQGSRCAVLVLRRRRRRLRQAWPHVAIERRADSGCAVPRLYAWCAAHAVPATIGLIPHPTLERLAAPLLAEAEAQRAAQAGATVRLVEDGTYQAGRWSPPRRVLYTADVLAKGPTTRFVVTTHAAAPAAVYDASGDRGQSEHFLKDSTNALAADRLSDHRFWANQFISSACCSMPRPTGCATRCATRCAAPW